MGTKADHHDKAEQNQCFLKDIDKDRYPDWVVTVAFYKALHLVEMLFATQSPAKHSDNHRDRHDTLKRNFKDIWRHYLPLYTLSRRARYKVRAISTGVGGSMEYALSRLGNIESLVASMISV